MNADAYLLPEQANADDLSSWFPLVPSGARIISTNLFGDAFFLDGAGAIRMLDRGAASVQTIAASEDEFRNAIIDDREGWQLRPLADRCRSEGKLLGDGQCYAFTTLPLLGGEYKPDNVWVAPWREWFALTTDIYRQIKDLPDGTPIRLNVSGDGATKGKLGFLAKLFSK